MLTKKEQSETTALFLDFQYKKAVIDRLFCFILRFRLRLLRNLLR